MIFGDGASLLKGGLNVIKVFYDGCCEPKNPGGNAGFGAVIFEDDIKIHEISNYWKSSPSNSNNVAEYLGLTSALEWLIEKKLNNAKIDFFGDNMMTVRQMNGDWRAKQGMYIPHYKKAFELKKKFKHLRFTWIPREENGLADELSKGQLKKNGVVFSIQPE